MASGFKEIISRYFYDEVPLFPATINAHDVRTVTSISIIISNAILNV